MSELRDGSILPEMTETTESRRRKGKVKNWYGIRVGWEKSLGSI